MVPRPSTTPWKGRITYVLSQVEFFLLDSAASTSTGQEPMLACTPGLGTHRRGRWAPRLPERETDERLSMDATSSPCSDTGFGGRGHGQRHEVLTCLRSAPCMYGLTVDTLFCYCYMHLTVHFILGQPRRRGGPQSGDASAQPKGQRGTVDTSETHWRTAMVPFGHLGGARATELQSAF